MNRRLTRLLLAATFLVPSLASAVTEEDFELKTSQDLLDLCTAPTTDPRYRGAINYCHGYLVGAADYHLAANAGPDGDLLVCFPTPPPSRNAAISMFITWLRAHPQYLNELPVETEFRFLIEKWPCTGKEGSKP